MDTIAIIKCAFLLCTHTESTITVKPYLGPHTRVWSRHTSG